MLDALTIIHKFFPKVRRVIDSTHFRSITVTRVDVAAAQRKAHSACALARACNRECKLDGAIIALTTAYLVKGTQATRYKVPSRIREELVSFDRGAGFAPGEYYLTPVPVKARLGLARRAEGELIKRKHGVTNGNTMRRFKTAGVRDLFTARPMPI